MGNVAPHTLKQVHDELLKGPGTERQVWIRLGMWSITTVDKALRMLAREGKAVCQKNPWPCGAKINFYTATGTTAL